MIIKSLTGLVTKYCYSSRLNICNYKILHFVKILIAYQMHCMLIKWIQKVPTDIYIYIF